MQPLNHKNITITLVLTLGVALGATIPFLWAHEPPSPTLNVLSMDASKVTDPALLASVYERRKMPTPTTIDLSKYRKNDCIYYLPKFGASDTDFEEKGGVQIGKGKNVFVNMCQLIEVKMNDKAEVVLVYPNHTVTLEDTRIRLSDWENLPHGFDKWDFSGFWYRQIMEMLENTSVNVGSKIRDEYESLYKNLVMQGMKRKEKKP